MKKTSEASYFKRLVEMRQAAGQFTADLNRNCSAHGIYQPQRFGTRLIAWQEITLKASYGTLK
jgi:hypothetical protein